MSEKMIRNNEVNVVGEIVSEFAPSHEAPGGGFYMVDVAVRRLSGQKDILLLVVSERLLDVRWDYSGGTVGAIGQFRPYNRHEGIRNRLELSAFVREVRFVKEFIDYTKTNKISLDGYICKPPVYRRTPLGREIADILLAVNRSYGKSDCILCISWARSARHASGLEVGSRVRTWGRVRSREYVKQLSGAECKKRIAYEVSISRLEEVKDYARETDWYDRGLAAGCHRPGD